MVMPSNGNGNSDPVKVLTILVYVFLGVLTLLTGWHTTMLSTLPDKYVRLERYQCDMERVSNGIADINKKLDRLIERGGDGP